MSALEHNIAEQDVQDELDALIARIRASGRGRTLPVPSSDAVDRLVAQVAQETPMSREEEVTWNRAWMQIVDDMHRRDRADTAWFC
jgi:hypothetical protein